MIDITGAWDSNWLLSQVVNVTQSRSEKSVLATDSYSKIEHSAEYAVHSLFEIFVGDFDVIFKLPNIHQGKVNILYQPYQKAQ